MSQSSSSRQFKQWNSSERYINREFSWLQFNQRVLSEAANPANPLLERLRFLSIFESNLDEFYMVRVSGLIEQVESHVIDRSPDGMTPAEQIRLISETTQHLRTEADQLLENDLLPALAKAGIDFQTWDDLSAGARAELERHFKDHIFQVCTPLLLDPSPSTPFISNRSLNLAVLLKDENGSQIISRLKIPTVVPRLIRIGKGNRFILLEELVQSQLKLLFPEVEIVGSWRFRVLRDADIEIRELEAADLITSIEGMIRKRRFGDAVLLEYEASMPESVVDTLLRLLELDMTDTLAVNALMGLDAFHELIKVAQQQPTFPSFNSARIEGVTNSAQLFEAIREQDLLLHHPFDSFRHVQQFVDAAVSDDDVIGIKQTLYRVGSESPIVESLLAAAESGKQVAVLVELKARFDESNNLGWARALERAGAHVSFGFPEMKVHCKLCQIVRRERGGIQSYTHIGTGNYNPQTARLYTDLGIFTCNPEITLDVSELFNLLTGFSKQHSFRQLLVSPLNLREGILARIHREIAVHRASGNGQIIFKLNSLVDPEVIDALYDASIEGVSIELLVRGISCIRPGVDGLSDNIRVRSVVGRFLEHSRVYFFQNGEQPEALIGSSDLMRRNLDRRIEVLTPIQNPSLVKLIKSNLLDVYLKDNTNSWMESSDGSYLKLNPDDHAPFTAQNFLIEHPLTGAQNISNR